MFKRLVMLTFAAVFMLCMVTACGKQAGSEAEGKDAYEAKGKTEMGLNGEMPSNLPKGFPKVVPFYKNAKVINADTYGEEGFTVVYDVDEAFEKVVAFYMNSIEGMDESGIGEEEAYFEGMDIGEVHINGLTISDTGEKTQVFITLNNYGAESGDKSGEDSEDEYAEESDDAIRIKYEEAKEVPLDKKYPSDIVPIYPDAKVIFCSVAPSGSAVAELVLPADTYKAAVEFYKKELELTPEEFTSDIMVTETFSGTVKGWKVSVQIGLIKTGNNDPAIAITVNSQK